MEITKYYSLLILITPFTAIGGLISKVVDLLLGILLLLSFIENFNSLNFQIKKGTKFKNKDLSRCVLESGIEP